MVFSLAARNSGTWALTRATSSDAATDTPTPMRTWSTGWSSSTTYTTMAGSPLSWRSNTGSQVSPPGSVTASDPPSTSSTKEISAARLARRRRGRGRGRGDWLAFLDADDWYYPERLRWHADWIARDPALDFCTGDYEYRRPDGSLISRSMEMTEAGRALLCKAAGALEVLMGPAEMESFIADHFGDTHTLTVPRSTFLHLGGYPLGRAVCEDVNFLIRLCAISARVGVVCEPMAVYLIHSGSATRSDPLRAQRLTVEALIPLRDALADAPRFVQRGYRQRLSRARLNLAYALLRYRHRVEAVTVAATSFALSGRAGKACGIWPLSCLVPCSKGEWPAESRSNATRTGG